MLNHFESKLRTALNNLSEDFSPGRELEDEYYGMSTTEPMFYHSLPEAVRDAISDIPGLDYEQIHRIYKDDSNFILVNKSGIIYRIDAQGHFKRDDQGNIDKFDFGKVMKSVGRNKLK